MPSTCQLVNRKNQGNAIFEYPVSHSVAEILRRVPVLDSRSGGCGPAADDVGSESQAQEAVVNLKSRDKRPEEIEMQATGVAQKIKVVDSVRETINQDGAVLLDIKQGLCFSMNPVGSKIWEMLKKQHSLEQIANALEVEFQVPRSQIDADIDAFLAELRKRKLIEEDVPVNREDKGTWISRLINLRKPTRP